MADGYLLESGTDHLLLEDGSGIYVLDTVIQVAHFSAGSRTNTSDVASCPTNAFTATSGKLYIAFLIFTDAESTAEVPSSVSLDGATPPTVTQAGSAAPVYNTVAAPLNRMTAWWFIGDGVSRTLTAIHPDNGTGYIWFMVEVTNANNTSPIVQAVSSVGDAGTTATTTLATFESERNVGLICASIDAANAISAEAGGAWTEVGADSSIATPTARASVAVRTPGTDTSPSMTFASADWGCIAIEIRDPDSVIPTSNFGVFGIQIAS